VLYVDNFFKAVDLLDSLTYLYVYADNAKLFSNNPRTYNALLII